MTPSRPPIFLQRQSYRHRRLVDTARVIPVFGSILFLIPLIWSTADQAETDLAARGIYLFLVWFLLVLATAVVSHLLRRRFGEDNSSPQEQARASDDFL